MKIVHTQHARQGQRGLPDRRHVDAFGNPFQQDVRVSFKSTQVRGSTTVRWPLAITESTQFHPVTRESRSRQQ